MRLPAAPAEPAGDTAGEGQPMASVTEDVAAPVAGLSGVIARSRYRGDVQRLEALSAARSLKGGGRSLEAQHHQATIRAQLLAEGVRADMALLPTVALAVRDLQARAGIAEPLEVYVFDEGSVNAFVTRGRSRVLVGLSSGCVNALTPRELEFVIGHELGHLVFGHVDVDTPHLQDRAEGSARTGMALRAWQRAAEISADRAGLICCGSLGIATSAFFKTLCGVRVPEGSVDPRAFAAQWHELEKEIVDVGSGDHWQGSHPFPPLRMSAMMMYWDSLAARAVPERAVDTAAPDELETSIERLLMLMDPLAREDAQAADPVLVEFLLWGGLAIALADGRLHETELARLREFLPAARLQAAVDEAAGSFAACLDRFRAAVSQRHGKLKAMEIHRIMEGLLQVVHADGTVDPKEVAGFKKLGELLGVGDRACELLMTRFTSDKTASGR